MGRDHRHGGATVRRPSASLWSVVGTVIGVIRQCSRTGCAERATSSFAFQYVRSLVWLEDLHPERDPHCYDLCARHADRLKVPSGWLLEDRRSMRLVAMTRLAS
jgi:hypothetical protein